MMYVRPDHLQSDPMLPAPCPSRNRRTTDATVRRKPLTPAVDGPRAGAWVRCLACGNGVWALGVESEDVFEGCRDGENGDADELIGAGFVFGGKELSFYHYVRVVGGIIVLKKSAPNTDTDALFS